MKSLPTHEAVWRIARIAHDDLSLTRRSPTISKYTIADMQCGDQFMTMAERILHDCPCATLAMNPDDCVVDQDFAQRESKTPNGGRNARSASASVPYSPEIDAILA